MGGAAVQEPGSPAAGDEHQDGYARGLSARTVQMIAIGGAIGTGLFFGSGAAIEQAGPALILAYLIAGLAIFVVMRALGELLLHRPVAGSFSDYATEFLGSSWGFAVGWTYWLVWVTTCMAEITVAGNYIQYWFPGIPVWVTSAVMLGVLFAANLISVKLFGEAEFWFALVKVATIVGMIVLGILVLLPLGIGPDEGPTLSNLWADGGVFPLGLAAALLSLQIVMFAYIGVELVGVTASEAADPKVTLRRAINSLPLRIGLFYIGSLVIIMSVQSWRAYHEGESPFVSVFSSIGIPAAAGIVNFVLLTAALSSCNSGIYSTGRMLHTLSLKRDAPALFSRMSSRSVPLPGLTLSAGVMALGIVINLVSPEQAFTYLAAFAAAGIVFVWGTLLVCHLVFRRRVARGEVAAVDYRLPGAPVTTVLALTLLGLVVVLLAFTADGRLSLIVGAVWFLLLPVGYRLSRRRQRAPRS
ncbi:amino acid permease [Nakamurella leprariae]|uniref:Amino acid permease n=1 Tax=Nakamurella leprariae TaxID=2803911 RepID=A0A938YF50_9ACTN|nr:amino acid permease [Nakamurella leprariae]MBM9466653.1 amino acid permease [Nakamurella leprariae]